MIKDKRIIQILSDIEYWDTCPQSLKEELPDLITHLESKDNSVLHSIMQSHSVIHIEIEKSMDQHYIKVGRLSNMKYQVWEDQGNGTYNKEGKEWETLEKALAYSETLR